jgi:hypothetical protein
MEAKVRHNRDNGRSQTSFIGPKSAKSYLNGVDPTCTPGDVRALSTDNGDYLTSAAGPLPPEDAIL